MNEYNIILNSELDRAVLASGIFPAESHLELLLKRKLAKGFAALARRLDPAVLTPRIAPSQSHSHC